MNLEISNQITVVSDLTRDETRFLVKLLTYDGDDKFVMDWKTRKFKFNHNYTRYCLLEEGAFPAGLTGLVIARSREQGFTVTVQDLRVKPAAYDLSLIDSALDLRYYQNDGVQAALRAGRGIIQLPTGAGKTLAAVALISAVPVNWLFLAPKFILVEQMAKAIRKHLNIQPGIIGDGKWSTGPITLATVKTLHSRRDTPECRQLLREVGGIIADECHGLGGDSYYGILMASPAYYRFGLSATPGAREDGRTLRVIGALGRVVYEQSAADMVDQGWLAKSRVVMHRFAQTFTARNPMEAERIGIIRSKKRNDLLISIAKTLKYPALVFVRKKLHGQVLNKAFLAAGIKSLFVWGDFSEHARAQAIKGLEGGSLEIVVCTTVFQEGVDIPVLKSGLVAVNGRSVREILQRLGRLTRLSEGKNSFELHDILDECGGDQDDIDNPCGNRFNANQAKVRFKTYTDEGHTVEIV